MLLSAIQQKPQHLSQVLRCCAAAVVRSLSSQAAQSFRAKDLEVQVQKAAHVQLPEELPFGKVFTDHMLLADHTAEHGWGKPRIVPFGPLQLHPAAQVLHYGSCCFEGMKAYLGQDGRGRLFRPDMNFARLRRSAKRIMLADFDTEELQECVKALLRLDRAWLPDRPGHSMYIRPFMFSTDGALGVSPSKATALSVILSPVGPYFKSGVAAVRLFLDTSNVRAWPGGVGQFKIGGNYAPTVTPQAAAKQRHDCSQVVYALPQGPDPADALISECGAMNMMFVFKRFKAAGAAAQQGSPELEVVTPPLDGTILPGVTRDSIIQLLKQRPDVLVSERPLTVRELLSAHASGLLLEVFGCGTACVVQPVSCVVTEDGTELALPPAGAAAAGGGPDASVSVAEWARQRLSDIQYGRVQHPWSVPFE
uniref:branched-chain-amino-acid transaminase n=1 Tax=Tetradesmus obliquus TaxID=3088 RepID=A0A383W5S4_TETOB|eukprot:jgi/Sobl393_1/19659/SZX72492.1